MAKTIKIVTLVSHHLLISEIEEAPAAVPGEPDCRLINPFIIKEGNVLEPWLLTVTKDDIFMISSDKILTLVEPTPTLLEKYLDLTKPTVVNPTIA